MSPRLWSRQFVLHSFRPNNRGKVLLRACCAPGPVYFLPPLTLITSAFYRSRNWRSPRMGNVPKSWNSRPKLSDFQVHGLSGKTQQQHQQLPFNTYDTGGIRLCVLALNPHKVVKESTLQMSNRKLKRSLSVTGWARICTRIDQTAKETLLDVKENTRQKETFLLR